MERSAAGGKMPWNGRAARGLPITVLLVFVWLIWTPPAGGQEGGVDEMLRRIAAGMSAVRSIEADFIQTRELSLFDEPLEIRGRLYLQRPDRFAWRVASPLRYHFVMEGAALSQWDEDTDRVVTTDLSGNPVFAEIVGQITGWFFGAYDRMTLEYSITLDDQDPMRLHFIPHPGSGAAAFVREIAIRFQPDLRHIRDIVIIETEDALLVCAKDRAPDVRRAVDELKERGLDAYL